MQIHMRIFNFSSNNTVKLAWLLALAFITPVTAALACSSNLPQSQPASAIANSAMAYIKSHHMDAAPFIADKINFTKVDTSGKGKLGYSQVIYNGGGWSISIGHAVVPELVYEISASYEDGKIVWIGLSKDGVINEQSYNHTE